MKKILILLLTLLLASLFLLFSDKGNEFIKPYLSQYLTQKSPKKIYIEIQKLQIDFTETKMTALINKKNTLHLFGDFSLLQQTLDMNYTLNSREFPLDVKGEAKGSFGNIEITGQGQGFDAKLNYQFYLKNRKVEALQAHVEKANIEEILVFLKQDPYAKGEANIDIEIPYLKNKESKGKAHIETLNALLNTPLVNKKLKLNLPLKSHISANVDVDFQGLKRVFKGDIESSLGRIEFENAHYDIETKSLSSEYKLNIKEMNHLKNFTKRPLFGSMELQGSATYKEKNLSLRGTSKSLGGQTLYYLEKNSFQLNLKAINLSKLLTLLGEKQYASGTVTSDLYLRDLKQLRGKFTLHSSKTKTENRLLNKDFDLKLTKPIYFMFSLKGVIKEGSINMQSDLLSDLFNLNSHNIRYKLEDSTLIAPYTLQISNLAKLESVTQQKLRGEMYIKGEIHKKEALEIRGETTNLDGTLKFNLQGDKLQSKLTNVSLKKLMHMLHYPEIFQAKINGELNYNIKSKMGQFESQLPQAHLLPNKMTKLIKKFQGSDLSKEQFNNTELNASLFPKEINFSLNAKSNTTHISLYDTKLNKKNKQIESKIKLTVLGKEFEGTIKGDIHNPDISINASKSLKEEVRSKIIEKVEKYIDPQDLKRLGIGDKQQEKIRNLFNGLFK